MYYTYFVSVITTIEKLFQIQSKTTGIIMSATEIGQIGSSLLLTYYGGQGHRPKWIAWGMILFAVSSFTCSMPHFIFGEQLIHQNEMLFSGVGPRDEGRGSNTTNPIPANLCKMQERAENSTLDGSVISYPFRLHSISNVNRTPRKQQALDTVSSCTALSKLCNFPPTHFPIDRASIGPL